MHVLVVTNMYPTPSRPDWGVFVYDQVKSLRAAQVDVDVLAFTAGGRVGPYGQAVADMRRLLRQPRYPIDLVHAHYGLSGFVARMQFRCPVVVTFHGNDLVPQVNRTGRPTPHALVDTLIGRLAALAATRCILVADILKPFIWPRRGEIIPMGIDLDLFKPMSKAQACQQLGLPDDRLRVAFVAHPDNFIKRFDLARAAVQRLQEQGWQVELLPVYGVHHHQVPMYLNACDVLVQTSMQEASPTVIKEALACNLPVVATNAGDTAERIRGVRNCVLCEPQPQAIAAKLADVLSAGGRSDGRDYIQSVSLPSIAQRVLAVYQDVLRTKP